MYTRIEFVLAPMTIVLKDIVTTEVCRNGLIRIGIGTEKHPIDKDRLTKIQLELSDLCGDFDKLASNMSMPYSIQISRKGTYTDLYLDPKYFAIKSWNTEAGALRDVI